MKLSRENKDEIDLTKSAIYGVIVLKEKTLSRSWNSEYINPEYWDDRTALQLGMPCYFRFYQNLNDVKLRRLFSRFKGLTLDAGCGDGRFLGYADVGLDFSSGMLDRSKSRHKPLVRGSILCLPFIDCAFVNAFSVDVLIHVERQNRKAAVKELFRVAENSYIFYPENRSVIPRLLSLFAKFKFHRLVPFLTVLIAAFMDRFINT